MDERTVKKQYTARCMTWLMNGGKRPGWYSGSKEG